MIQTKSGTELIYSDYGDSNLNLSDFHYSYDLFQTARRLQFE